MKKIWVIQGSTGEYSDHCEWIVCAYLEEKQAQERAEELNKLAKLTEIKSREKGLIWQWEKTEEGKTWKESDPDAWLDNTGTDYTAFETTLF